MCIRDRNNTDLINLSDSSEQQSMDLMEEMELFQMKMCIRDRIQIKGFVRYETGDGLEKKEENFAEEVAKQMGK